MNKIKIEDQDLKALMALDPVLSKFIQANKRPVRHYAESFFISIVQALIGQLISKKSAATIYKRLEVLLKQVTVDNYLQANRNDVIACGIYKKKYEQIYNIAKSIESGILDYHDLVEQNDQEVIKVLCKFPGIGQWSAEMIMMHGLRHPDILAFGDFGVRSGIKRVYNLETLSKSDFNKIKERLSPYGTIASLYFWQAHQKG